MAKQWKSEKFLGATDYYRGLKDATCLRVSYHSDGWSAYLCRFTHQNGNIQLRAVIATLAESLDNEFQAMKAADKKLKEVTP